MEFGKKLKEIRILMGFRSARAFYQRLQSSRILGFNYPYYVKIENGKALPSPAVAEQLALVISGEYADRLTLAYCRTLFPKQTHLFRNLPPIKQKPDSKGASDKPQYTVRETKTLSEAQVAAICESKEHYYLFLLLTLARNPITEIDLRNYFEHSKITRCLSALEGKKICKPVAKGWIATSTELNFPPPHSESIRKFYSRMEPWDHALGQFFGLDREYYKFLFRRVSARHLGVALNLCGVLTDLLLSAEEVDPALNEETVYFELKLLKGAMPG